MLEVKKIKYKTSTCVGRPELGIRTVPTGSAKQQARSINASITFRYDENHCFLNPTSIVACCFSKRPNTSMFEHDRYVRTFAKHKRFSAKHQQLTLQLSPYLPEFVQKNYIRMGFRDKSKKKSSKRINVQQIKA